MVSRTVSVITLGLLGEEGVGVNLDVRLVVALLWYQVMERIC
jgi:hypothetical protein